MIKNNKQSGFAMLFSVLVVSLILSIAVSISNITLKQAVLSNLAKDSAIAFYQADAAVECGMHQDTTLGNFPLVPAQGPTGTVPDSFYCGNVKMSLNKVTKRANFYRYESPTAVKNSNNPCFVITFDKATIAGKSRVEGSGFNICKDSPRRVERTLEVKY